MIDIMFVLIRNWIKREKRAKFLVTLKNYQMTSASNLGLDEFYVCAFDVSARTTIEDGVGSLDALNLFFDEIELFRGGGVQKNAIAVDIGANVGNYALYLSHKFSEVIAIEAHPHTYRLLKMNCDSRPRIKTLNYAISSKSGGNVKITEVGKFQSTMAKIENQMSGDKDRRSFQIERRTLDALLSKLNKRVGLIKVDVEGHDLQAIEGATKTIKSHKPIIIFEYNAYNPEMLEKLNCLGYSLFLAPTLEVLSQFKNKSAMLSWVSSRPNSIKVFRQLYGTQSLMKFSNKDLPLAGLVMTFPDK